MEMLLHTSLADEDPTAAGRLPDYVALPIVIFWATCIGIVPVFLRLTDGKPLTKLEKSLGVLYWTALASGFYVFTHLMLFTSPHFHDQVERPLRNIECMYLMTQIIITVGFGDFTPVTENGMMFFGGFTVVAIIIASTVLATAANSALEAATSCHDKLLGKALALVAEAGDEDYEEADPAQDVIDILSAKPQEPSIMPLLFAFLGVAFLCAIYMLFFMRAEGMRLLPAAYMMISTLSTVGFGDVLPSSDVGMVFLSFWMVLGCAAMLIFMSRFVEYVCQCKHHEHFDERAGHRAFEALVSRSSSEAISKLEFMRFGLLSQSLVSVDDLDSISKTYLRLGPGNDGLLHTSKIEAALSHLNADHQAELAHA